MRSTVSFEEALPRPEAAPAEPVPLAERLQLCSRLLAVAAEELVALEHGEVTKRRELGEQREELMLQLQPSRPDERLEDGPPVVESEFVLPVPQQVAQVLAEVLYQLEEREEEERRMQDRWSSLEEDALKAIHVGGKIVALRAGRYPNQPRSDARLDLRF
jgi:hypothetical protein